MARDAHGRFVKGSGPTVRDKDNGADALLKRMKEGAAKLSLGIHEDVGSREHPGSATHEPTGATIAEVASFHELGLGVPRRSFLTDYVDENEKALREKMTLIGKAVIEGKIESTAQGLDRFGLLQKGEVQRRIRDGIEPELDDATIERKGSSTPLIDGGALWGSIDFKVEKQ